MVLDEYFCSPNNFWCFRNASFRLANENWSDSVILRMKHTNHENALYGDVNGETTEIS